MSYVIIKNADMPEVAEFLTDSQLNNLVFEDSEEADEYLMKYAEGGVFYSIWSGE